MPKLYILGGANGVGKSQKAPKQMAILKLSRIEYIHPETLTWVKETLHLAERLQQKLDISEEKKTKPNIQSRLK